MSQVCRSSVICVSLAVLLAAGSMGLAAAERTAFKEKYPEAAEVFSAYFQLFDLHAECRLGDVQRFRRPAEAAVLDGGEEVVQLAQVQGTFQLFMTLAPNIAWDFE